MVPRRIELQNQSIGVEKGQEPDPDRPDTNGQPALRDNWTIVMIDRFTGDHHRITFSRDVRDELVRQLTGGIVLAGGEFPKI